MAIPTVEPTSLVPSSNAAIPIKGDNAEDGGGRVSGDASDFGGGAASRISNIGKCDRVTNGITKEGDKDNKDCIFEDDIADGV